MRKPHGRAIVIFAVGAGLMAATAGSQRVRVKDAGAVEAEALVVDLSLGLCQSLAKIDASDPEVVSRLLSTDPRSPAENLRALGIDFEAFRDQIAKGAGARPLLLFLSPAADPVEEARKRDVRIVPWPPQAPPVLMAGRNVDTLIVFEPLSAARIEPAAENARARAQMAALAELRAFALAEDAAPSPLDKSLYFVDPPQWKKSAVFEHTRCYEKAKGMTLVAKLTYDGGSTDTERKEATDDSWHPCQLVSGSGLEEVQLKQVSRKKPGNGPIVAGTYFRDSNGAGPALLRSIPLK